MITILIGVSNSGKTTFAEKLAKGDSKTYIVSRDTERLALFGDYRMGSKKEEEVISKICHHKILRLLEAKYNVIIDNTHLKIKYINEIINKYNQYSDIRLHIMPSLEKEELIKRGQKRFFESGKLIPEKVLHYQLKNFEELDIEKVFYPKTRKKVKFNSFKSDKTNVYIVDIDGTLSCSTHRDIFDFTDEEVMNDTIIEPLSEIIKWMGILKDIKKHLNYEFVFMSGRSDKYYESTKKWLQFHFGVWFPFELYMRKEGDYRKDTIVKEEMYKNLSEDYNVIAAFDDRQCMIEHWQNKGIYTFNVSQGNGYF